MKILVKTWSATEDFACYIIKGWGEAEYNLGSLFFKLSLPGGTHPKTQWVAPGQVLIWQGDKQSGWSQGVRPLWEIKKAGQAKGQCHFPSWNWEESKNSVLSGGFPDSFEVLCVKVRKEEMIYLTISWLDF